MINTACSSQKRVCKNCETIGYNKNEHSRPNRPCLDCVKSGRTDCSFVHPLFLVSDAESRQFSFLQDCTPFMRNGLPLFSLPDGPHLMKCIRSSLEHW
jgi:hypothetical protein